MSDPSETPAEAAREALRAAEVAAIPRWYSPWVHLAFPSLVGIGVVALSIYLLHDVQAWELAFLPVFFVFSNLLEWRAHKLILHKRTWYAPVLYDRHTPIHHRVFITEDMAIRSAREFRLVLIPAYGVLLILITSLPLVCLLWWLGQPNLAALFVASSMGYVVSYEWLHLAYHAPRSSWVGRTRTIAILRRHHATHHDPRLMQAWNFNVTLPLWDWIRGTIYRAPRPETAATAVPPPGATRDRPHG